MHAGRENKSTIAEHAWNHHHPILWEETLVIIDRASKLGRRLLVKESLTSRRKSEEEGGGGIHLAHVHFLKTQPWLRSEENKNIEIMVEKCRSQLPLLDLFLRKNGLLRCIHSCTNSSRLGI